MKLALAALLALVTGCAVEPSLDDQSDSTRTLASASIDFERFAAECGVSNPPFADGDVYDFDIVGPSPVDAGPATIDVSFHRTIAVGQPLAVTLGTFGPIGTVDGTTIDGQSGTLPDTDASFAWDQGTSPDDLDASALTGVTVTFDQLPDADGKSGVLTIRMVFTDGGIYDTRATAPLMTAVTGCPAG